MYTRTIDREISNKNLETNCILQNAVIPIDSLYVKLHNSRWRYTQYNKNPQAQLVSRYFDIIKWKVHFY